MMMGSFCTTSWYAITLNFWIIMVLNLSFSSSFSQSTTNNSTLISHNSLDDYLYNYSSNQISKKAHTGVLYNISLSSNFSGMEVSLLRLRGYTLWLKGANFSSIKVPPRVLTIPYVKRVGIMHENLGNWSSHYHELPGYTILTAIMGVTMYDAMDLTERIEAKRLNIDTWGDPITVKFPEISLPKERNVTHIKCVKFNPFNGNVELSNMTRPNVCSWRALGHFGLAIPGKITAEPIPSPSPSPSSSSSPWSHPPYSGTMHRRRRKDIDWKWWVIGFGAGLAGLGLLGLASFLCYSTYASRKIRKMERRSEKSESLGTIWVGNSRMPSASMTRTQAFNMDNDSAL